MNEVTRLKKQVDDERRRQQEACKRIAILDDTVREQQVREKELQKQQERVQRLREERDRLWDEIRHLKDENYSLMHDITRLSEEKNGALMSNRDLQLTVRVPECICSIINCKNLYCTLLLHIYSIVHANIIYTCNYCFQEQSYAYLTLRKCK